MMRDLRKLFNMTGEWKRFLILLLLRCPFEALRTMLQASFLQFCFNAINQGSLGKLYWACVLFGIGNMFLFLYNGTVWTMFATFVTKWVGAIRKGVFSHISKLSLQRLEAQSSGDWFTRLNADVQSASAILNQPLHLQHACVSIVNIGISALVLITINPTIFALVILFLIPHLLISQLYIIKPMTKMSMDAQEATAKNTADMNAVITCADIAILYDAQGFLLDRFEKSSLNLRRANMKIRVHSAIGNGLLPIMGMSGYLVLLLVSAIWIKAGNMTFGELTAAFQYRGGILVGTMMLINSLMNIKTALAGARRVNGIMDIPLEE
ncbi:MAG TPA: ABC transporter ATP-binding protein [Mobilitalea sp.]|nr:ABC transporter ATP-binding protein [Mobilitalea sp.]